jgi:putative ABC transport system permease protein
VAVSVGQRKREIGILRSVGVGRGRVTLVFVAEAAVIGSLGSLLGIGFGKGIATVVLGAMGPNIARFYENVVMPEPTVSPALALGGFVVGLVSTLLAAYAPARAAARVPPVEALRRDLHATARSRWPVNRLAIAGVVLMAIGYASIYVRFRFHGFLGVGLELLGSVAILPWVIVHLARILRPMSLGAFGIPGRLGVDNVEREMGRSTLTAAALVLATGTSLTMATYTHSYERSCLDWLDQALPADLFITSGSPTVDKNNTPYAASMVANIGKIPGVAAVDPVRSLTMSALGRRIEVLGVASEVYLHHVRERGGHHVVEGPSPLPDDLLLGDAPSLVLSEATSARSGKHLGDTVELPSPTGTHAFKVVGVVVDYSNDQGWAMMDRRWIREFWQDDQVEATNLFLERGASVSEVAAAVRRELGDLPGAEGGFFVSANEALKEEVRGILRATLGVSKAAETISLVVAVLGVIGTMLAAVLDRTREIGVLRAIGATRRQVLAAIVAEAAFLGLASVLVGLVSAVPTAMILMNAVGFEATGWTIPYLFPTVAAIRTVVMIFLFALASGALPGLRAARLVVTRALAYE